MPCGEPATSATCTVLGRSLRYQEIPADLVAQRFAELGLGEQFGLAYASLLAARSGWRRWSPRMSRRFWVGPRRRSSSGSSTTETCSPNRQGAGGRTRSLNRSKLLIAIGLPGWSGCGLKSSRGGGRGGA